ncbi:MAG: MBL fold metallo-hydrolase [Calditrichaeota bacterium]|nr:MAG: MBL fold metallo-hydrolase [Calditrichota bacterium]
MGITLLDSIGHAQLPTSRHFRIEKLADGVYAAIHKPGGYGICNAGIVDLGEKTLIFDPFISPEAARDLLRAAEALTSYPVAYVVNSHFHNDHIRGNQVFAPPATVISTTRTRELIAQHEPEAIAAEKDYAPKRLKQFQAALQAEQDSLKRRELSLMVDYFQALAESNPQLKVTLPNQTFDTQLILRGKDRTVKLISYGKGHTESDLIMILPKEKIVFTGDLLFIDHHPYLADGFPEEWIAALNNIGKLEPEILVPGHGPVGQREDISTMIGYIEMTDRLTRQIIREGKPIEILSGLTPPHPYDTWLLSTFFIPNLRFMYQRARGEVK